MDLLTWAAALRDAFGYLPENYLVLDTETLCFGRDNLPVEIGNALVQNRVVTSQRDYLLDWTRNPHVEEPWLRDQLRAVKERMEVDECGEATGRHYHTTYELLRQQGRPVEEVLRNYLALVRRVAARDFCFVGHNLRFDLKLLHSTWSEFLAGDTFLFSESCIWDTGAIFKAASIGLVPKPGEDLHAFMHRATYAHAPGVKWNLQHCLKTLRLDTKHQLDCDKLHGAGFDCFCTHLIFEEIRTVLEG